MINLEGIDSMKILLVDDDEEYAKITKMYLESNGLNVTVSTDPEKALEMCKQESYSIILLDYYMGAMDGEDFLEELRKFDKKAVVILQTGYSDKKIPLETLVSMDIQGYYDKTKNIEELLLTIISTIKTMKMFL
ncbi:MAG: response regulator [Clostridia bacterium]|nr:response regulator [Clostridia bacterium]